MITDPVVLEWIESTDKKYGQFTDPARYGKPPYNPGNGMWANDAKRWATFTPEKKVECAMRNLYPPHGKRVQVRDRVNDQYCDNVAIDSMLFNHAQGRYRARRKDDL